MYANFKVIGLNRFEIKPESTASDSDALATRPSDLLNWRLDEKVQVILQIAVLKI